MREDEEKNHICERGGTNKNFKFLFFERWNLKFLNLF